MNFSRLMVLVGAVFAMCQAKAEENQHAISLDSAICMMCASGGSFVLGLSYQHWFLENVFGKVAFELISSPADVEEKKLKIEGRPFKTQTRNSSVIGKLGAGYTFNLNADKTWNIDVGGAFYAGKTQQHIDYESTDSTLSASARSKLEKEKDLSAHTMLGIILEAGIRYCPWSFLGIGAEAQFFAVNSRPRSEIPVEVIDVKLMYLF